MESVNEKKPEARSAYVRIEYHTPYLPEYYAITCLRYVTNGNVTFHILALHMHVCGALLGEAVSDQLA